MTGILCVCAVMLSFCSNLFLSFSLPISHCLSQRVHRIGQTRTTYVKRFIVRGSVEERILELQEKKKFLAQSVAINAEEQKQVNMQDLVDLFREK